MRTLEVTVICVVSCFLALNGANGFVVPTGPSKTVDKQWHLRVSKKDNTGGYQFGDISRLLAKKATEKVNELTGKDTYYFGDLSKHLDKLAKQRVQGVKGETGEYRYEFGDLTKWAGNLAQEKAANYAGKETAADYKFGDISRTVVSKVQSGEYSVSDVYLALRVLLAAGFSVLPVAHLLPVQALFSLVELGLAKDMGGRLLEVLATTVDSRMKEALTGNANYQLGDLTKDRLRKGLASFTGKDTYQVGDILRAIQGREESKTKDSSRNRLAFDQNLLSDLTKWDERFIEQTSSDQQR